MTYKVLVIGSSGQLAVALKKTAPSDIAVEFVDRSILDLSQLHEIQPFIIKAMPDIVINATAFTAVDLAEDEPEQAYCVNRDALTEMASACLQIRARLIHVSTDFVFDGGQNTPYRPTDKVNPLGIYGASKVAGEQSVRDTLDNFAIIRTAWVYSDTGKNFVKTMLRLMNERDELGIVYDQVGSPTSAYNLASVVWLTAFAFDTRGTFHYTDAGVASWYDFAYAIYKQGLEKKLVRNPNLNLKPILSEQFKTRATRPKYSVLDCSALIERLGINRPHWTSALSACLDEVDPTFSS